MTVLRRPKRVEGSRISRISRDQQTEQIELKGIESVDLVDLRSCAAILDYNTFGVWNI